METNRDRIISASLELFNDRGYSQVTTNHIARFVGISPGNLYYHFRNKEQIAAELHRQMAVQVKRTAAPPLGPMRPEIFAGYYLSAVQNVYDYRFIFDDLQEILRRDADIARLHRELMQWATDIVIALFARLVDEGLMAPAPPDNVVREGIALNTTVVLTGWWSFLKASRDNALITSDLLRQGAIQAFLLIEPYLDRDYSHEVRAAVTSARMRIPTDPAPTPESLPAIHRS
jgi:AcrR family transcriptional regulator